MLITCDISGTIWGVRPIAVNITHKSSMALTHGLSNDDIILDLTFYYMSDSFENWNGEMTVFYKNVFFLFTKLLNAHYKKSLTEMAI